jgi:hypothetical protein
MAETTSPPRELWRLTRHLRYFQHHGRLTARHEQLGELLAMSPDIVDLLEFHREQARSPWEVDARFGRQFGRAELGEFLSILESHRFLVDADQDEDAVIWRMVPVRARAVAFHQPSPERLTLWYAPGRGAPRREEAPRWAARLWASVDGERTLEALYGELQAEASRAEVEAQVLSWVGYARQALRLSRFPLRRYRGRVPPYLRSEMPFAPWSPGDPLPPDPLAPLLTPVAPPHAYYQEAVRDADAQFEEVETTFSHLLRRPHPLLGGQTYAQRVAAALRSRGLLRAGATQLVEIGAGRGDFAAGLLGALLAEDPEGLGGLRYDIVELSPALRQQQARALGEAGLLGRVTWHMANVEEGAPATVPQADLLLCNEVIGDLTTARLTRAALGLEEDEAPPALDAAQRARLEAIQALCARLQVELHDAPPDFFFNEGALRLIEAVPALLRPGGAAWITEYGDLARYPRAASHLDHIEFSIHFGHLQQAARALGLEAAVEDVQALIGWDRHGRTLVTSRGGFAALRAMLEDHGLALEKVAWTDQMLARHLGAALPMGEVGNLEFEDSDQRCMGIQPHEFKALLLRRQA